MVVGNDKDLGNFAYVGKFWCVVDKDTKCYGRWHSVKVSENTNILTHSRQSQSMTRLFQVQEHHTVSGTQLHQVQLTTSRQQSSFDQQISISKQIRTSNKTNFDSPSHHQNVSRGPAHPHRMQPRSEILHPLTMRLSQSRRLHQPHHRLHHQNHSTCPVPRLFSPKRGRDRRGVRELGTRIPRRDRESGRVVCERDREGRRSCEEAQSLPCGVQER